MQGIASQVGLSIFHFDNTTFGYEVFPYTFYVCPRSLATLDDRFVCQASCLQFLTRNNFDFNKVCKLNYIEGQSIFRIYFQLFLTCSNIRISIIFSSLEMEFLTLTKNKRVGLRKT